MAQILGKTEFWMGRFDTPDFLESITAQTAVDNCAQLLGMSIVGYVQNNALTLLHWPETRAGYHEPSIDDCKTALESLAGALQGRRIRDVVVGPGRLHAMIGRRRNGYGVGSLDDFARIDELERMLPKEATVTSGDMVSARYIAGGTIEPYGEPVAIITGPSRVRPDIHVLADRLQQHHYVIEAGPAVANPTQDDQMANTQLYETKWAKL